MADSGILQQAIIIEKVNRKHATHFSLCNGDKIRYLISLNDGSRQLSKNISAYSGKLSVLMKLIVYIPFSLLKAGRTGYFVRVKLHPAIQEQVQRINCDAWNMIVGTYDEKQKLVLQCFSKKKLYANFVKIGNKATEKEMVAEMDFLKTEHHFHTFRIPKLLGFKEISATCPFNLQVTKEFNGCKVEPQINKDIVKLYKELSEQKKIIEGVEYEFSHGDFAPWNLKKDGSEYVLFDWEHCGYRMKGFDLMHYATIIEIVMNGRSLKEACETGLNNIRQFDTAFSVDIEAFQTEFQKLRRQIG